VGGCQTEQEPEGLYIYHEDWGNIEFTASVLALAQKQFGIDDPWSIQWADWCDKPRPGEFGGGAVVIYKGEATYHNSDQWVHDKIKELTAAP
jgi:hypothetical protein